MKIIAVLGSPSANGNTCVLAREVLRGAEKAGADTEEIFLADYQIEYCKGCINKTDTHCMATGQCVINDDLNRLKKKLYDSDGIVWASPSYGIMETARMKNFMIDRIGMFTVYTSGFGGKYFAGVSTCGGIGARKVARNLAKHYVGGFHKRGYMSGYLGVKLGYDRIETKRDDLRKADVLGQKLASDIKNKRRYVFQNLYARLITKLVIRKIVVTNIYANKDGAMKAVYLNLVERKLIRP